MIVYNITIKILPQIETEWLIWQKNEHIPEIMSTGLFYDYRFYRLLEEDESDGLTYVVQYFAYSKENYNNYISSFAEKLRDKAIARWGEKFLAFRTVMQVVN
jgi:hypothetical protein